jgi:small nuclear ribonucleoprotein (snRNP)-like protein
MKPTFVYSESVLGCDPVFIDQICTYSGEGIRFPERQLFKGIWNNAMLDELLERKVVLDLSSSYVCLGRLTRYDEHFLELKNADLHDLRDTETTRELYVAESVATGIKRNRRRVIIRRAEVIAISLLEDVVDE